MYRRETLGVLAATAITGCVGESDSTTSEATVTSQTERRVAVANCPTTLPRIRGETYCYEDLDEGWLGAGAEKTGETELTLRVDNRSESNVRVGPSTWALWQQRDGEWMNYIDPADYDIAFDLKPGDSYAWVLSVLPPTSQFDPPKTDVSQDWGEGENRLFGLPLASGEYCFGVESITRLETDDPLNVIFPLTVASTGD